jgi:uncharacterized protein (DUF849 family)
MPVSVEELTRDAVACEAEGACATHLHPRDVAGSEQVRADVVD